MIKLLKQLNVDPANKTDGASAVADPVEKKGVDYTLFEEALGDKFKTPGQQKTTDTTTTATGTTAADETPEQIAAKAQTEKTEYLKSVEGLSAEDKAKIDATKTPEQLAAYNKAAETTTATAEQTALKLKEDIKLGEGGFNFISAGKELGYDVKEDTITAFKEAQNAFVENKTKESWSGNFQKELEKETPQVQEAYLLAKNGLSAVEIEQPLAQLNHVLSFDNYNLVKADLESRGLSDDIVEQQLAKLVEDEKLDGTATVLRSELNAVKETKTKERADFFSELKAKEQTRNVETRKQTIAALEKEAKGLKEFMGLPLHETVPTGILRNYEKGKYDDLMSNPKNMLQAILFAELGDNAVNEIRQKAQADVLKKNMQQLTNTPIVDTTKNVVVNTSEKKSYHSSIEEAFAKK